jgi:hypothetical protein
VAAALAPDAHSEPKFRKIPKRPTTPHVPRRHRVAALMHVAILFFWNVNSSTARVKVNWMALAKSFSSLLVY